jgi:hypothetical protein
MKVNLSGLADDTLAKLQVYKEHGGRTHWGTHPGNGSWEIVLYEKPGVNYIVTVAADGYTTNPISYTVQISGTKVYVVEEGQVTSEEAMHLDFQFIPIVTPKAPTAGPGKTIFFPRQEKTDGERAVMEGEVDGTLVLADNCIRVDSDEADASYLLIWPPEFNITIENSSIKILNGDGELVARIGDKVHIGGGEIQLLSMLDKTIQEQVPRQCPAPYWIIGDKITTVNP